MTADIRQEDGLGHWAGRDATEGFLPDEEIQRLNRDLRILIASNGTLTRVLGVVANDEIVVQIVDQQVRNVASTMPDLDQLPSGRVLQRRIFLKGRNSGASTCRCRVAGGYRLVTFRNHGKLDRYRAPYRRDHGS